MLYLHTTADQVEAEGGLNARDQKLGIQWLLPTSEQLERDSRTPFLQRTSWGNSMKCRHGSSKLGLPLVDLGSVPPSNAFLNDQMLKATEKGHFACI